MPWVEQGMAIRFRIRASLQVYSLGSRILASKASKPWIAYPVLSLVLCVKHLDGYSFIPRYWGFILDHS